MKLKLLFALLVVQMSFAQQHRTCGVQQQMERIMADPALKAQHFEQQAKFEFELQKLNATQETSRDANATSSPAVVTRIPVAVHFPSSAAATAAVKTCLRAFAQNQINILNADYNAANADMATWNNTSSAFFPGVSVGNMNVQFELATQNHPAEAGLVNGNVAVTFGTDFLSNADIDATWSGYFNLVVRNLTGGVLGYSPLGASPSAGMTVVIDNNSFGSGGGCVGYVPGAPFNLGRTLTHELGHFFNLNHTFDSNTCDPETNCNSTNNGDGICDTPQQLDPTYGCPGPDATSACLELALSMNYMDYTDDACMYMFTLGQKNRMTAWYNSVASQIRTDVLANDSFVRNNFTIYPNPNKGSFNIQFAELSEVFTVEVFDIMGRTVYENNFDQTAGLTQTINIENPSKGVYFINVKSGMNIVTKKITVE